MVFQVLNYRMSAQDEALVWLGYDPYQPERTQIIGARVGLQNWGEGNVSPVPPHGIHHQFPNEDMMEIFSNQILNLRVWGDPDVPLGIVIHDGICFNDGVAIYVPPQKIDLSFNVAEMEEDDQYFILVYVNSSGTVLLTGPGNHKSIETESLSITEDFPEIPAGSVACLALIRLYTFQKMFYIGRDGADIIDLRFPGNWGALIAPKAHHPSHEDGGGDEISVNGLSGLLVDGQNPLPHASSHEGGADSLDGYFERARLIVGGDMLYRPVGSYVNRKNLEGTPPIELGWYTWGTGGQQSWVYPIVAESPGFVAGTPITIDFTTRLSRYYSAWGDQWYYYWQIQRDDGAGEVLASGGFTPSGNSQTGDDFDVTGTFLDATPTTGVYVVVQWFTWHTGMYPPAGQITEVWTNSGFLSTTYTVNSSARLPIGDEGDLLVVDGGEPHWLHPADLSIGNADTLDGLDSTDFAPISHTHTLEDLQVAQINHTDTSGTTTYVGMSKADGTWWLQKIDQSSNPTIIGHASITNNGGYATYSAAWTARASLTYGRYDEAF